MECSMYVCPVCRRTFRIKGTNRSILCVDCGDVYLEDMHVDADLWKSFRMGYQTRIVERVLNGQDTNIQEAEMNDGGTPLCHSCGMPIDKEVKFCPNCGEKNNAYVDPVNSGIPSENPSIERGAVYNYPKADSHTKRVTSDVNIHDIQVAENRKDTKAQKFISALIVLLVVCIAILGIRSISNNNKVAEESLNDKIEKQEATETVSSKGDRTDNTKKDIPEMNGTNVNQIIKEAAQYGVTPQGSPERWYPDCNVLAMDLCNSDYSVQMDLIYNDDTKEILCAVVRGNGQIAGIFIQDMAPLLCPTSDSGKVGRWVSDEAGNGDFIMIHGVEYSVEFSTNSISYYAGYQNWMDWNSKVESY